MKIYVGVTDTTWYNYLAHIKPDEVNFWQPGGKQTFKALGSLLWWRGGYAYLILDN